MSPLHYHSRMVYSSDDDTENMAPDVMSDDYVEEIEDSGDDSDFQVSATTKKRGKKASPPPVPASKKKKPLKVVERNETTAKKPTPKKKTASSQYQKLSQLEHVLKRPDTYIGSTEMNESKMWAYDAEQERMVFKDVKIVPGLYKIFDEILVNAADNKIRDPNMTTLKVNIDREKNVISVMNNGKGIPIEMHDKENMYIPELIFGNLLTSSNYDDDEKKVTGGRNGYGAKLCNIFSTKFTVETANKEKKYTQVWTNNMGKCAKAKIVDLKKPDEYTKITFEPDLEKFNMSQLDDDIIGVLYRRVYDLAGTMSKVKVYLNNKLLKVSSFKAYVEMFVTALREQSRPVEDDEPKPTIIHEKISDRWEVAFGVSDGNGFNQVSFVNSIATTSGGTHVNYIADQLVTKISDLVKKKNRAAPIRPAQIKNNMFLFVNCLIENPAFTSQTKEQLTTKVSAFGSKCPLPDDFMKKVLRTSIIENVLNVANANADKELKRTDGGRKKRLTGFSKLDDANKAGTAEGEKCTLILTEGDSAKALAVAGLAVVGRDYYGVFPLRGKLLNVREASHDQIMKNGEIQAIKQIMGLQHKKHYTTTKGLRYGHIMIMTDQDHDGSHIKGLIINFLESSFPGLLDLPGFLVEFITPIVKVSILRGKKVIQKIPFYTMPQFELWRSTEGKTCIWTHKYYKGLGTSNPESEGREYFAQLDKHLKTFLQLQAGDKDLIELAFAKKNADARKDWLRQFRPGTHLDPDLVEIPISDFINKELILFSMADNVRSIPSVLDGFKPGQRKIIYGCFLRSWATDSKVAQLTGFISEKTGYHHGEQSLYSTIVGMAQNFVGANNLYYLMPNGSFGSRATGGKDASAARYIYTEPNKLTRKVFNPADDPLYTYVEDDDKTVEPEWYLPIIPSLLVNGSDGIGTGWSTNIPPYNPTDLIDNIRRMMNGVEPIPMSPWYRGWTGTIERLSDDKFRLSGRIDKVDDHTLVITELPARMWTQTMKDMLLDAIVKDKRDPKDKGWIDDMTEEHGVGIKFVVKMTHAQMSAAENEGLLSKFKLTSTVSTANMMAFDPQGRIQRYETPEDILKEFYHVRLEYYQKRKDFMSRQMQNQLEKLTQQARFIKLIIDKKLSISNRKKAVLIDDLIAHKFPKFGKDGVPVYEPEDDDEEGDQTLQELQELAEKDDEAAEVQKDETVKKPEPANYNYLLGMSLWSLTKEQYEKLLKQRDEKENELVLLLKKTAKDLWNDDLDDFVHQWYEFLEEDREKRENLFDSKKKGGKKGKGAKKKGGDDDDDDFVLGTKKKAAPKKKKAAKMEEVSFDLGPLPTEQLTLDYKRDPSLQPPELKPAKGKKGIKVEKQATDSARSSASVEPKKEPTPEEPEPAKKPVFGKGVSSIFGSPSTSRKKDDYDMEPDDLYDELLSGVNAATSSAKKESRAKAKPKPKAKASVFDDLSDGDPFVSSDDEKPVKKKAAAPKKKSTLFDDDDDDDIMEEAPPPAKKTTVKKAPTKKTAKVQEVDISDSEDEKMAPPAKKPAPATKKSATTTTKKAPAKKPPAKSKKGIFDDEDDDVEISDQEPPPPRAARSRRGNQQPKSYNVSVDISDDEEDDDDVEEVSGFVDDEDEDDEFDDDDESF